MEAAIACLAAGTAAYLIAMRQVPDIPHMFRFVSQSMWSDRFPFPSHRHPLVSYVGIAAASQMLLLIAAWHLLWSDDRLGMRLTSTALLTAIVWCVPGGVGGTPQPWLIDSALLDRPFPLGSLAAGAVLFAVVASTVWLGTDALLEDSFNSFNPFTPRRSEISWHAFAFEAEHFLWGTSFAAMQFAVWPAWLRWKGWRLCRSHR